MFDEPGDWKRERNHEDGADAVEQHDHWIAPSENGLRGVRDRSERHALDAIHELQGGRKSEHVPAHERGRRACEREAEPTGEKERKQARRGGREKEREQRNTVEKGSSSGWDWGAGRRGIRVEMQWRELARRRLL